MNHPLFVMASGTFAPALRSLSGILEKAEASARENKVASTDFAQARLAPDMFPLSRQVQTACDHAKGAMARLAGVDAPAFADEETDLAQLRDRIARTIAYVETFSEAKFEGAENRDIQIPLPGDLVLKMTGVQFLRDWSFPHFYFHLVTAYDILRHEGIELGKRDYLAHIAPMIGPKG